jgi:hypothetical protein
MVDHIYGRRVSLVPAERPHMFAKEITLYVDYVEELANQKDDPVSIKKLKKFQKNLEKGMDYCLKIAKTEGYQDENMDSIPSTVEEQRQRLEEIINFFEAKVMVQA